MGQIGLATNKQGMS